MENDLNGAKYVDSPVIEDEKIITSQGPEQQWSLPSHF